MVLLLAHSTHTNYIGCAGMLCCIVLSILLMITHSNFGRGLKEKRKQLLIAKPCACMHVSLARPHPLVIDLCTLTLHSTSPLLFAKRTCLELTNQPTYFLYVCM